MLWGNPAKRHVRALMIVGPHLIAGIVLHLLNGLEQVVTEPVVADCPVITFDVVILLWVTGLDMIQPNAWTFRPGDEGAADVFRAVVAANGLRFATPLDDLIQRPDRTL